MARSSRLARGYFLLPSAVYPWDDGERPMLSRLFRFVVGALAALFGAAPEETFAGWFPSLAPAFTGALFAGNQATESFAGAWPTASSL